MAGGHKRQEHSRTPAAGEWRSGVRRLGFAGSRGAALAAATARDGREAGVSGRRVGESPRRDAALVVLHTIIADLDCDFLVLFDLAGESTGAPHDYRNQFEFGDC